MASQASANGWTGRAGFLRALRDALPGLLRWDAGGPRGRGAPAPASWRFEVRVCANGRAWEVHADSDALVQRHPNAIAALRHAHDIAQHAWLDQGREATVKLLSPAGRWEVDMVFGISP